MAWTCLPIAMTERLPISSSRWSRQPRYPLSRRVVSLPLNGSTRCGIPGHGDLPSARPSSTGSSCQMAPLKKMFWRSAIGWRNNKLWSTSSDAMWVHRGRRRSCSLRQATSIGEAYEGYPIDYPHPLWAEQTGGALAECAHPCHSAVALGKRSRRAARSGLEPGDAGGWRDPDKLAGQALHPAIIWMDRRASAQCERVRQELDDETDLSADGLEPGRFACRTQDPLAGRSTAGVYARTAYFLSRAVIWRMP